MKPKTAMMSSIGQMAIFDEQGQQIPDLQMPLLLMWAEVAEKRGYQVDGLVIECRGDSVRLVKNGQQWNFAVL
jgi:hypothetical protein